MHSGLRVTWWIGFCALAVAGLSYLWTEHGTHVWQSRRSFEREWLLALFITDMVAALLHYADNIVSLGTYPDPPWLTRTDLVFSWIIMTLFGLTGYRLYLRSDARKSFYAFCVYSLINWGTLLHYLVVPMPKVRFRVNALVMVQVVATLALWTYVVRLRLRSRSTPLRNVRARTKA